MKKASFLADFAEHCADTHRPYIYGTFGMVLDLKLLMQKAAQYPSRLTPGRVEFAKEHYLGKRTDDCIGLSKNAAWLPGEEFDADPVYDAKTDWNADGTFERATVKGPISTIPKKRGICVRYGGHTGILVDPDNGIVVEERGFDYGCVRTKLKDRAWTDWYEHPLFDYSEEPKPQPTPEPKGDTVMIEMPILRKGDKGEAVKTLQIMLNGLGYRDQNKNRLEVDGSFGGKTLWTVKDYQAKNHLTIDGIVGKATWTSILK